jgi:N-acyl-D-aspartate/D-glutamate deacylase
MRHVAMGERDLQACRGRDSGGDARHDLDFNARFYPKWDRKRAAADLERFALDPKSRIGTLSRGMKLKLGLRERGTLAIGNWADVVIFDPEAVGDRATFLQPYERPVGISGVLVNGVVAAAEGKPRSQEDD